MHYFLRYVIHNTYIMSMEGVPRIGLGIADSKSVVIPFHHTPLENWILIFRLEV